MHFLLSKHHGYQKGLANDGCRSALSAAVTPAACGGTYFIFYILWNIHTYKIPEVLTVL